MANKLLITQQDGTPKSIVLADHAGDFSPATATDLRDPVSANRTNVQLSMASVVDGAARQSNKFDFGADFAQAYRVRAAFELAATPTAGDLIELYLAPSQSSTAANGNAANVSGADSAYSGYSSNLADSVKQLDYIGAFVCTAQTTGTVQVAEVSDYSPVERYGTLVVKNESNAAMHSDDVEIHIVFDPIIPEVQ